MALKPFSWLQDQLREIVAANPDNVATCAYFDKGGETPQCVVGHALARLGVTQIHDERYDLYTLASAEGKTIGDSGDLADDLRWSAAGVRAPGHKQRDWIATLQSHQDNGLTWAESLRRADEDDQ